MASATQEPPAASGVDAPAARVLQRRARPAVRAVTDYRGDLAITVERGAWVKAATLLRDHPELDYKLFLDLCGVDYLDDDADEGTTASRSSLHVVLGHARPPRPAEDQRAREGARACPRSPASTRAPTGSSARPGTSTGSCSPATRSSSAHPDPRLVRRPPDAQGLPDRPAPRAEVAEGAAAARCPRTPSSWSSTSARRIRRCTGPSACRRSWTARRSRTARPRSATCTGTSRRWRRSGPTGRSSRTPTGSTTARRS